MQTRIYVGGILILALRSVLAPTEAATLTSYRAAGWKYFLGNVEASAPIEAWRVLEFDDAAWSPATTPVGYPSGDAGPLEASIQTTLPTSALAGYTCVFLRKTFVVTNVAEVEQLNLTAQYDDAFAAWVNGTEVGRANVATGPLAISTLGNDHEVAVGEAVLNLSTAGVLVEGTNVLAIQLFNSGAASDDLFIDARLESVLDQPPVVLTIEPPAGTIQLNLGFIIVTFNENVTGVDASDLLINGTTTSTSLQQVSPREYQFIFPEPPTGTVTVAWSSNPGIADTDGAPSAFVPGVGWSYTVDPNALATTAVISEFMADNVNGIRDEDGDRRDWIEIYNPSAVDINLGGYYLTDTVTNLTKWTFPSLNLTSRRHVLVWASAKDRINPAAPLHTNFRLGKEAGGYLALANPQRQVVSQFASYPAQTPDVSYGRDPAEPNLVGYFVAPTPGALNLADSSNVGFAGEPVLSHASGVYADASITLTLTTTPGQIVRYTLDGSEPTNNSPIYSEPINFTTNMMIKARAYSTDPTVWPSRVVARNFVMLDASARDFNSNLPILIMTSHGRAVPQSIPPGGTRPRGTFVAIDTFRGRSSIRGTPDYHGLAQFEVFGNTAAGFPKKPWRVELNDELGNDREAPLLGLPAEADWKLINPHNDKTLLNDFLGHELWEQMGHYSCRRRLVEVFVQTTAGGKLQYPRDYYGVMVLIELIERGRDRVDIAQLGASHTTEPAISGGYIIKKDKDSPGDLAFSTSGGAGHSGQTLKYHEPKPREITAAQQAWIRNYVNRFEASMYAANWTNAIGTDHYSYYIDVDAFVDQHLHVEFTKQVDGYRLSSFYSKDRNGKLMPNPVWDWNLAFGNANYLQGGKTNGWYWNVQTEGMTSAEHIWLRRLVYGLPSISTVAPNTANNGPGDPDFRQKITDRWSVLRTNILNGDRVVARIEQLAGLLAESAGRNWTKYPGVLNTYQWPNPEGPPAWDVDFTQPTYELIVAEMKKWVNGRFLWMDSQFLTAPHIDVTRNLLLPDASVALAAPPSAIYYTLDGSDPRLRGGGISPAAQVYTSPLVLASNFHLVARAYANPTPLWTPWSAPSVLRYQAPPPSLRVTEILYHPRAELAGSAYGKDDFQFIELKNTGTKRLELGGIRLTNGVRFTFAPGVLGPGQYVVLVNNYSAFQSRYGTEVPVLGEFTGSLARDGEQVTLVERTGDLVLDFTYSDKWYPLTDGPGLSLVITDENAPPAAWGARSTWKASRLIHGSPGRPEPESAPVVPVVINELLSNAEPPYEDAVELYNPTAAQADISYWYLTDDFNWPTKFQFPPYVLPPFGYLSFDQRIFDAGDRPGAFSFSAAGDEAYLFSANAAGDLTGYVHGFRFGPAQTNVSFGRVVTAEGDEVFAPQVRFSWSAGNAGPAALPAGSGSALILSELMYHPGDAPAFGGFEEDDFEFVELRNLGPVALDLTGAEFTRGISLVFSNLVLEPGQYAVVVTNTLAFASRYGTNIPVAGEFIGRLANSGERLTLVGSQGEVILDFTFSDGWHPLTDGAGRSLVLVDENAPAPSYTNALTWRPSSLEFGSPGAPDPPPRVGPVVISEIMYRPPDIQANGAYWNDTEHEFIELQNISALTVPLFDPARPTNRWRLAGAGEFGFPEGASIPAGGYLLVVSFNPLTDPSQAAEFRSYYGIGAGVPMVGPYEGSLDNDGGAVSLLRPAAPAPDGVVPLESVDGVHYSDHAPWPADADGLGQSLQRLVASAYGDNIANWLAAGPTPGSGFVAGASPGIILHPASATVPDSGTASALLRGAASGPGPRRYQWLYNGQVLHGATNAELLLQNIRASQAGEYQLVVLNPYGSAFSQPATVTVLALPRVMSQPVGQKVAPGANVSFFVNATSVNPPLRYQWYRNGFLIPNASDLIYSITNVQDTDEGTYYAVVTDKSGSVTSTQAELTVLSPPALVLPVPPARITAVAGDTITLGVQTRGTKPMLYRWRRVLSTGGGLVLTNRVLNVNYDFLTLPNIGTNLNNAYFMLILTNEVYTAQNLVFTNAYLRVLEDSDGNGLPDDWERLYFGSPTGAARNADPDGDTMSNYAEYIAGTDPTDAWSYLKIEPPAVGSPAEVVTLSFLAVSNRTYAIEACEPLGLGPWLRVAEVPTASTNRVVSIMEPRPHAAAQRVFRLVTPR